MQDMAVTDREAGYVHIESHGWTPTWTDRLGL